MFGSRPASALLAGLFAALLEARAQGEVLFDLLGGKAFVSGSDVEIDEPSRGNDFTVHGVSFDDESFRSPPWYGLRVGYFLASRPWIGGGIEFFHYKMLAETGEVRRVTGRRSGEAVDSRERIDRSLQRFDVSHGVNFLTADLVVRRGWLRDPERFPNGRIQPYAGFGVGAAIAHPENVVQGRANDQAYELGGAAVQVFLGTRVFLGERLGLVAEYKFSHASLDVGVAGGEARVSAEAHHLLGGITLPLRLP